MSIVIGMAEKGYLPDFLIKFGIRKLLKVRIREIYSKATGQNNEEFARELCRRPVAENVDEANDQHYELPTEFFKIALGDKLKYSSALYDEGAVNLNEAEEDMLNIYKERAQIEDGMSILDLGCGWGSFSLWIASVCPNSNIVGVSNSATQKKYIDSIAKDRGITNLTIITADMNKLDLSSQFDRIVSIEMFEHMRNYDKLFKKVARFMNDGGKAFVHVFSHKEMPYFFETEGEDNWMGRYFFTGGVMPSRNLFRQFDGDIVVENQWDVCGTNYAKTSLAWLNNMDAKKDEVLQIFSETYGKRQSTKWFNRWRIFFYSCAELFAFNNGKEWGVTHFLFRKAD